MLQLTPNQAATIIVGPVLDTSGLPYAGALAYTDFAIFKAGGSAPVALDASATATHYGEGNYKLNLTAADTDTLGYGEIILNKASYAMQAKDIVVGGMLDTAGTTELLTRVGDTDLADIKLVTDRLDSALELIP